MTTQSRQFLWSCTQSLIVVCSVWFTVKDNKTPLMSNYRSTCPMESPLYKWYYQSTETKLYLMPCFTIYLLLVGWVWHVFSNFYNSLSELLLPAQCSLKNTLNTTQSCAYKSSAQNCAYKSSSAYLLISPSQVNLVREFQFWWTMCLFCRYFYSLVIISFKCC